MSITILTGAPGHGKSYTSVQMIDQFVHEGKFIVTNVALRSDFAYQMARRHTLLGRFRKDSVERRADVYASRIHICEDLTEILRVRFTGKKEGRGKVIIEEAHRHMNVRAGRGSEKQDRKIVVEYASGHRHYGGDMILITQAIGNLDLQIKNLFEYHAEVRNLRKLPILGILVRLIPGGNLFIRKTVWNDKARTRAGFAIYGLSKRLANLYDTHSLEHTDWPDDAIVLPKKIGDNSCDIKKPLKKKTYDTRAELDDVFNAYKEFNGGHVMVKKVPRGIQRQLSKMIKEYHGFQTGSSSEVLSWISRVEKVIR
jgi:Zonular occludens toxin (Zot)